MTVEFCEEAELFRLVGRMVHQAYRNGAKEVYVRFPKERPGTDGERFGHYRIRRTREREDGVWENLWLAEFARN